jgi:predicted nucleic acid-binding protein
MKLVLDSNILFSAILKNSTTRNILVSEEFELFLSEYALLEIDNHRQFLLDKTKLSESAFTTTLNMLLERTKIIADETLVPYLERAGEIMKGIDLDDAPFIALALSFPNDGIWSNDKDLRRQTTIRAWTTEELLEWLKSKQKS